MTDRRCSVDVCDKRVRHLGLCQSHADNYAHRCPDEYQRRLAEAYAAQTPQHGTRSRYRKGCRCDACRRAEATYRRNYRKARR